jgi:mono/diheme cytochrome c family protein
MPRWLVITITAVVLVGVGIAAGVFIGRGTKSSEKASFSTVPVSAVGDVGAGARIWAAKRCGDCHSFAGKGGTDAPALDFMRGQLSATDIANMSGSIWNHVPMMVDHFKEEHIPFPSFTDNQMADLIAYLHSPAPQNP